MKDRFRFRAWNEVGKYYLYDMQDTIYTVDEQQYTFVDGINKGMLKSWKLEQCTGLKDKNGKLIYEGDILKSTDECFLEKYKVKWIPKFSQFTLIGINTINTAFGIIAPDSLEIIGNIHENPELLEGNNG